MRTENKDRLPNAHVKMIGVPLYTRFGEERKITSGFQIQTHNGTRLSLILFHKLGWLFVDTFLSTITLFTSKPQDFKNRMKNELPLLINVSSFLSPWCKEVWSLAGVTCGGKANRLDFGNPYNKAANASPHATVSQVLFLPKRTRMSGNRSRWTQMWQRLQRKKEGGQTTLIYCLHSQNVWSWHRGGAGACAWGQPWGPLLPRELRSRSAGQPIPAVGGRRAKLQDSGETTSFSHCDSTQVFPNYLTSRQNWALSALLGEAFSPKPAERRKVRLRNFGGLLLQ